MTIRGRTTNRTWISRAPHVLSNDEECHTPNAASISEWTSRAFPVSDRIQSCEPRSDRRHRVSDTAPYGRQTDGAWLARTRQRRPAVDVVSGPEMLPEIPERRLGSPSAAPGDDVGRITDSGMTRVLSSSIRPAPCAGRVRVDFRTRGLGGRLGPHAALQAMPLTSPISETTKQVRQHVQI